jgi:hypothetical protein
MTSGSLRKRTKKTNIYQNVQDNLDVLVSTFVQYQRFSMGIFGLGYSPATSLISSRRTSAVW